MRLSINTVNAIFRAMRKILLFIFAAITIISCPAPDDNGGAWMGEAVSPLIPEEYYLPSGPPSDMIASRSIELSGEVDNDYTLKDPKDEEKVVQAMYMWYTPIIGDFLPRSMVNGNSGKYTLFGEKVPYRTYEREDGIRVTETTGENPDVYFYFEYDPEERLLSFKQAILYELDFTGLEPRIRLNVTWADDLRINEDNSIHGEIFWAYYEAGISEEGKIDITFGNADFYSDDDIVGSVALNAYGDEFDVSSYKYNLSSDSGWPPVASMDMLDMIISIGKSTEVQDRIHSIENKDWTEKDDGSVEMQYFILAYCEKKGNSGKANKICIGQDLVSFVSAQGSKDGSQSAIDSVTDKWKIQEYSS